MLNGIKLYQYKLIPNKTGIGFTVDIEQDVNLHYENHNTKSLDKIPIQFNNVKGNFNCENNAITSLRGCPKKVEGNFSCCNNKLTSLKYMPEEIKGHINFHYNPLKSLEGLNTMNHAVLRAIMQKYSHLDWLPLKNLITDETAYLIYFGDLKITFIIKQYLGFIKNGIMDDAILTIQKIYEFLSDNCNRTDRKEKDYADMYRDFCENVLKAIQSNELY